MIYGTDHVFSVCAPAGWVLDNESLVDKGIYAAFYRAEFSYKEALARHTLMYVSVQSKREGQQTASEMMKLDLEKTKRASPNLVIEKAEPILMPASRGSATINVPVQTFLNDYQGGYESVAYIEDEKTITLIVISSISDELLRQDYPSFIKLVQSYTFFSSDAKIEKLNSRH